MKNTLYDMSLIAGTMAISMWLGLDVDRVLLIAILSWLLYSIRMIRELIGILKDVSEKVVYLICLAMKNGKTCGSTAFRVRRTERGIVVECVDCKTKHEVNKDY
ncbi:hypothetical protein [Thermaerobacillus caldiproteolyticus]|uniref:hypothetical protein n=1 Tax=Thermaerobacillus caldiproteolyticus TaxID=247480 RepID=UPI001889DE18|nr:hypothetical protein [Anoxybacillus caldiproteolyticus]QPA33405.1 hypothetical protein ISX45_18970 [Anoxybacillus caldiproteolyticus]